MERLTRRVPGGWGVVEGYGLNTLRGAKAVVDRLSAYEDTGLEPEEINRVLDAYGRGHTLCTESAERLEIIRDIQTAHLRELAQAEQDGRLVVLPWASGETIYEVDPEHGVVTHTLTDDTSWCMHSWAVDDAGQAWYDWWGPTDTPYKTREEAEAALKGGEPNA